MLCLTGRKCEVNTALENKLESVLKSLETKLLENADYFRNIEAEYRRPDRTLKAKVSMTEDGELLLELKKEKKTVQASELIYILLQTGKEYDDCSITYNERGSSITVWTEKNNVKVKYNETQQNTAHDDVSARSNRDYLVKVGEADEVLREIGVLTNEGKVRNDMIRKYNQIDHFVELIDKLLKELSSRDSITVLDCACGKSYLSFVLNYYIKEKLKKNCHFIGLDISEQVIEASRKMAANLGYKNMEFHKIDIQHYMPDKKIDLAISLHGCDTATDMAIAAGIRYNADAIVVIPCCHRQILSQYSYEPFKEITKYGILKARLADTLTDGIRGLLLEAMGYEVSIVEYISPLDTPKNIMIRAVKKTGRNRSAYDEYLKLKEALGIEPALARLLNI